MTKEGIKMTEKDKETTVKGDQSTEKKHSVDEEIRIAQEALETFYAKGVKAFILMETGGITFAMSNGIRIKLVAEFVGNLVQSRPELLKDSECSSQNREQEADSSHPIH
jgi:hypothetical protein